MPITVPITAILVDDANVDKGAFRTWGTQIEEVVNAAKGDTGAPGSIAANSGLGEVILEADDKMASVTVGSGPQKFALGFVEEAAAQSVAGDNHIWKQGWGLAAAWSVSNPQFWLSFERNFTEAGRSSDGAAFELNIEYRTTNNINIRPFYLYAPKTQRGGLLLHLCADDFAILKNDTDRTVQVQLLSGVWNWNATTQFVATNNASFFKQENHAGDGRLNLPYINASDRIYMENSSETQIDHRIGGALVVTGAAASNQAVVQIGDTATTIADLAFKCVNVLKGQIRASSGGGNVLEYSSDGHKFLALDGSTLWATMDTTGLNLTTGHAYFVNALQVLGARRTGWAAATGTATRTTFLTSTITLPQLAERVKALIDDFITHGAIGA